MKNLQKFTVEEFQNDFDNLFSRVENGESFIITSEYGDAIIVPYKEIIDISEFDDEFLQIHQNHEEGS